MVQVVQQTNTRTLLANLVLGTFVATFVFGALSLEYWPRVFVPLMVISAFAFCVFFGMLLEYLSREWKRTGYPPAVGLATAGFWFCIATLGWWTTSTNGAIEEKVAIISTGRIVMALLCLAELTLLFDPTLSRLWFWLLIGIACLLFALYVHLTARFLTAE